MTEARRFQGFPHDGLQFLVDLALNNDRLWFQPRRPAFERLLKRPLQDLCRDLDDELRARGLPFRADPATSPFRIHRDTRFARDKSPYKTSLAARFPWDAAVGDDAVQASDDGDDDTRRPSRDRAEAAAGPSAYFSLTPGSSQAGGGIWHPRPATLAAWRRLVVAEPGRVHAALDEPALRQTFPELIGGRLSRVPRGFPRDHPDASLLTLTDVGIARRLEDDEVMSPDLPRRLADTFEAGMPLFRLLAEVETGQGPAATD